MSSQKGQTYKYVCSRGCGPGWRVEDGWLWKVGDVRTGPLRWQMLPRWCTQAIFHRAECQTGRTGRAGFFRPFFSVQVFDRGRLRNKHILSAFHVLLLQFCLTGDETKHSSHNVCNHLLLMCGKGPALCARRCITMKILCCSLYYTGLVFIPVKLWQLVPLSVY